MRFLFYLGRVALWILVFPVGIWRSMVHHRKKAERRAVEQMRRELSKGKTS